MRVSEMCAMDQQRSLHFVAGQLGSGCLDALLL